MTDNNQKDCNGANTANVDMAITAFLNTMKQKKVKDLMTHHHVDMEVVEEVLGIEEVEVDSEEKADLQAEQYSHEN